MQFEETWTPPRPCRIGGIAALVAVLLAAGCGSIPWDHDHFDRLDRISLDAGEAQARNITIQSVNPLPDKVPQPPPTYDGRRVRAVMDIYYGLEGGGTEEPGGGAGAGALSGNGEGS